MHHQWWEINHLRGEFTPRSKTCKHCGEEGLYWIKTEHGWRLAGEQGKVHVCAKNPAPEHKE